MSLPTLNGTGRVIADPELRYSASGSAVLKVRLAFNSRRLNQQTQQWEDSDTFFVRGTAFGQLAESIAESVTKGLEVVVTGRMKTEQWEKDGEKRSEAALIIDSIGPSLRNATAKVVKAQRSNSGGQQQSGGGWGGATAPAAAADPWATNTAAAQGSGYSEEPPF